MLYSDFDFVQEFKENWNKRIKKFRNGCFILSLLMIVIGLACFFFPVKTFHVVKILVSMIFIGFGICAIISYCLTTSYFKDPIVIIIGVTHILFGILLFEIPADITAMSLTIMLAVMLLFYGAEKISFSRRLSFFGIIDTSVYTVSGILTIILSIIFMIIPLTSAIVINYMIAAYLIVDGIILLIETMNMKKLEN